MNLEAHFGHEVEIAKYSDSNGPVAYAIECVDCFEVIVDESLE